MKDELFMQAWKNRCGHLQKTPMPSAMEYAVEDYLSVYLPGYCARIR